MGKTALKTTKLLICCENSSQPTPSLWATFFALQTIRSVSLPCMSIIGTHNFQVFPPALLLRWVWEPQWVRLCAKPLAWAGRVEAAPGYSQFSKQADWLEVARCYPQPWLRINLPAYAQEVQGNSILDTGFVWGVIISAHLPLGLNVTAPYSLKSYWHTFCSNVAGRHTLWYKGLWLNTFLRHRQSRL